MSRQDTRAKVFAAAIDLMAEQGYTATTVEAIAERAGVAKGTVFYNFGSKEALFAALLEHSVARLAEALSRAATGDSALAALDNVVLGQLRFFDEHGPLARVLLAEMWRTAWQEAVAQLREHALGVYTRVLRDAVAAGDIRPDLDVETAATALFGMVLTVAIERRALHPDRPLEQAHATLLELMHGRLR
ncbi:TetR/AcrR family transcriptional regulator [Nonomuraea muscovyensis]|uniref:AcrR family transcriptional regulator n=1 Tax=Nonomuraea muscovyensis TaxID=1124761 RepID=A0A7X0BW60_9ACTN|nr:TetR/AcrR family transcriptional regulator [Nonomuraea muscovyensis]MBB6343915.1 AcrR family transcriptional regulator [Nonomuraea muscovyensis]MDF2709031.1 putative transcriptional regulator, TetR family [Nonomuraea muscovyensis]